MITFEHILMMMQRSCAIRVTNSDVIQLINLHRRNQPDSAAITSVLGVVNELQDLHDLYGAQGVFVHVVVWIDEYYEIDDPIADLLRREIDDR